MPIRIAFAEDAALVLREAGECLLCDPVLNNLVLTLLHARASHPEPGRYWIASDGGAPLGVVFQSPITFAAICTPMAADAVTAVVDAIAAGGAVLPGITAEAATAARFAGRWTERHKSAAAPASALRLYALADVRPPIGVGGRLRRAGAADRELLVEWVRAFQAETSEGEDAEAIVARRTAAGHLWLWEDGGPVSLAAHTEPIERVARVQFCYTPPGRRNRGYIKACVAELSRRLMAGGNRCILYTDLANPASNAAYRRIGYEAVAELLRYRFDPSGSDHS